MAELTRAGDEFEHAGVRYLVLDRKEWYCGFMPVGVIIEGANAGVKVPLVNSKYQWVKNG